MIANLDITPKEEEEEKGPGFSRLRMHLIAVELPHTIDILAMLKLILRIALSVDLLAAYSV